MRLSKEIVRTRRDDSAEAQIPSHQLLMRAGFISKLSPGIFTFNAHGLRVLRKVEGIVREEMNRSGAVEVLLPYIHPREIWEESKRWDGYERSRTFLTTKDRHGAEYALAPTAEEAITWLIREYVTSWRQLPVNYYQISAKWRDELRPRAGLIRGREFVMKDAYSFDRDEAGMRASYAAMHEAYKRVFERCGLNFIYVEADSGAIGGSGSSEFMALSPNGEDSLMCCSHCGYAANQEKANSMFLPNDAGTEQKPATFEDTPNVRSVEELEKFFNILASQMVKTIIYSADGNPVAVCMRGDQEINETKLRNKLGALSLELADEAMVRAVTGAEVGFAGPINMADKTCPIYFDITVRGLRNFLCGGNKTDKHWINVNVGTDLLAEPSEYHDLRNAQSGDTCDKCAKGSLAIERGIEVGHIFQLQKKYSASMNAGYLDETGEKQIIWMGCYGIGVSRIIAAYLEQNHDERGMIWNRALAPFAAVIVPAVPECRDRAESLYQSLTSAGIDVAIDDRDLRAGEMFADADLRGYPFHIVIGKKTPDGFAEVKKRRSGTRENVALANLAAYITNTSET